MRSKRSSKGRFPRRRRYLPTYRTFCRRSHAFPGDADWTTRLIIDSAGENAIGRKRLSIASDLRGIAIDLPVPLAKTADSAEPFELSLDLPFVGEKFGAKLGDVLTVDGRLPSPTKPFAARVTFGGSGGAPPERGIVVGGTMQMFDASGWISLARPQAGGGASAGSLLSGIDLRVADFTISSRSFGATHLIVAEQAGRDRASRRRRRDLGRAQHPGPGSAAPGRDRALRSLPLARDAAGRARRRGERSRRGRAVVACLRCTSRSTISCSARRASARPSSTAIRPPTACVSRNSNRVRRTST